MVEGWIMANPALVQARMMFFIAGMGGGGRSQFGAPYGPDERATTRARAPPNWLSQWAVWACWAHHWLLAEVSRFWFESLARSVALQGTSDREASELGSVFLAREFPRDVIAG